MKVSSRNIKEIKRRLERLYSEFNINPLDKYDDVKIGDEVVFIDFPEDNLEDGVPVEDFLEYTKDLDSLKKEDDSTVRMANIRQTILSIDSYRYDYLVPAISYHDEVLTLCIVQNPILIGLIASKEGIYNEDLGSPPCSLYTAIELRYIDDKGLTRKEEDELINRFLYHIATKYDLSIEIGEFDLWEDITDEEKPEPYDLGKESLVPYSNAMDYYSKALRIYDPDIQFHHLYKIIEHFSPIVSKKLAYERLNQKLDSLSVINRDYHYLDSLLELSKHYELSKNDNVLCKTVISECVDIVPIYEMLPGSVKRHIAKQCSFKYSVLSDCSNKEIAQIKSELSDIIYATRNRIVHAKMNWDNSGFACEGEDMIEMNEFMKALSQCLIVWNGRQPKEFRV